MKNNLIIIITGIGPAEWVSPSTKFETISSVRFSVDNVWIKLSEIWSLMPFEIGIELNVCVGAFPVFTIFESNTFVFLRLIVIWSEESSSRCVPSWKISGWEFSLSIEVGVLLVESSLGRSNSGLTVVHWTWGGMWVFVIVSHGGIDVVWMCVSSPELSWLLESNSLR